MNNKTRKHIWSGALVLSLAIVGVLAAFVVLAGNPATSGAHEGGPAGSHCTGDNAPGSAAGHDIFTGDDHPKCSDDATPTPPPTIDPTPYLGSGTKPPDSYVIEAPDFVDQTANAITRYDIVVEDEDGNEPRYDGMNNMVRIRFTIHQSGDLALGQVGDISDTCLPAGASLRDADLQTQLAASTNCTIVLNVVETDFFEIEATTVAHNTRLGISLTISDDALNETHTITFLNPRRLSDLRILSQCIVWARTGTAATAGHIELDILPSAPGGVATQNMPTHYVVVRDTSGGASLASEAGSPSMRANALPNERELAYADVNAMTGDPKRGLLTAAFAGAMRDTVYQVDVFTVDDDGSIEDHVRGHVRVGN